MELPSPRNTSLNSDEDFRAKASFGVAQAALGLLLPIAVLNFVQGNILIGLGSSYIVALLSLNVYYVLHNKSHENLSLFGLVLPGTLFMTAVFKHDPIVACLWCFPSIIGCYCMLSRRYAVIANAAILLFALPQIAMYLPIDHSMRVGATLFAVSLFSCILVRTIDDLNSRLQNRILHDPLTGLLNRLSMKDSLQRSVMLSETSNQASTLLAIDIDHFKSVNDRFGHDTGDRALIQLAQVFKQNLRIGDRAFRTGGEEFLILLPDIGEKEANSIAERLRREFEVADIIPNESITISVGAAQHVAGEDWQQWCKRADDHLYEAKRLGRNRVALVNRAQSPKVVAIRHRLNKPRPKV